MTAAELYLLVILVCQGNDCYQHRLYSKTEYATKEECQQQPIILERFASNFDRLEVACMTPEEWAAVPVYEKP